jgi:hypothetical protein
VETDVGDPALEAEIDARVQAFVKPLMAAGSGSVAIERAVGEIALLGAAEIQGSSAVTADLLAGDIRVVTALARRNGPAVEAFRALRALVADVNPARFNVGDQAGRGADRFAARVAAAEEEMTREIARLSDGRDALQRENAVLGQQERALWLQMRGLRRYARLAERLDQALEALAEGIVDQDRARATRIRADVLLAARRRRSELLTHLAVAAQGYAALRLIERTNEDLIRTIDHAIATTRTAVRAAALAARSANGARQLGQPVTTEGVRSTMAAAVQALEAINRSRSDVLETMQSTLRSIRADVDSASRPARNVGQQQQSPDATSGLRGPDDLDRG